VVFRPGGLRPFVTAPAGALADLSVPLPELRSGDGNRLARRVTCGAPAGPALLLDRVERALAAQADCTFTGASAGTGQLIGPAHLISTVRRGLG
jgi:hypothetical protein